VEYLHIVPYLIELREITGTAIYEYTRLDEAARRWCELDRQLTELALTASTEMDNDEFAAKLDNSPTQQTRIFDALSVFLAAWARVSLIIFPLGGDDDLAGFRRERGSELQRLLGLSPTSAIHNGALRDAWMHYDQHLDRAVIEGYWRTRQRFVRSSEAAMLKASALRLVEANTLVVHFRDASGAQCSASLPEIADALDDLQKRILLAWDRLREEKPGYAVDSAIDDMMSG
jgi:hypothetical protein